jgi:hypothetical protein
LQIFAVLAVDGLRVRAGGREVQRARRSGARRRNGGKRRRRRRRRRRRTCSSRVIDDALNVGEMKNWAKRSSAPGSADDATEK